MKFPFAKEAVKNLFSKPSTVPFPKIDVPAKKGYRGRLSYDPAKCTNCGLCVRVCSPAAITVETVLSEDGNTEYITRSFDMTSCTFCQTCEDFCDTGAIHLTEDYHMAVTDPKELIVSGVKERKKVYDYPEKGDDCVYCTLCAKNCPNGAITVDRANKTWEIDTDLCVQCGICISKCPKKCLTM